MRRALIIGIDHYRKLPALTGCANDAHRVKEVLEYNSDGSANFVTPRLLLGTGPGNQVSKAEVRNLIRELFADKAEIALLYFAGHGHVAEAGGYLCASDSDTGEDGLPLSYVMTHATKSPADNRVIVLDSCYSGSAANIPTTAGAAEIHEGMTILTASTERQVAVEVPEGGAGVFTNLLVGALTGAARNLLGHITPGSVYAHIDQSLGAWGPRPMFKTHVQSFVSLRQAEPPIALAELKALATHFPRPGYKFQLDPAYEPKRSDGERSDPNIPQPDPAKNAVFAVLQNYARVDLVRPVGTRHMYDAAMESKPCVLTLLGEHYRNLVATGCLK